MFYLIQKENLDTIWSKILRLFPKIYKIIPIMPFMILNQSWYPVFNKKVIPQFVPQPNKLKMASW